METMNKNYVEPIENFQTGLQTKKERSSNFELFRIILMLMIVAHHYVVNSGFTSLFDFENITGNMVFLQFFGFAGKTGINCFVLITGYFMVKSEFKFIKLVKLYLEAKFYVFTIYIIFLVTGYAAFSTIGLIKIVFSVIYGIGSSFVSAYIFLYMLIPFLNILIKNMGKILHLSILAILVFMFTIISTFFHHDTWNYLGWLITVYMIGAYIGMYPNKLFEEKKLYIVSSVVSVICMWSSILVVDFIGSKFGFTNYYYMMSDSHKLLALVCAVSLFLYFKNIRIKKSMFINRVASSTLGVLLIHANSDTMRQFLWKDLLNNTAFYESNFLVIHAICSVIGVYIVCVLIDQLRIKLIEKPLFDYIDRNNDRYVAFYRTIQEKFLKKFIVHGVFKPFG